MSKQLLRTFNCSRFESLRPECPLGRNFSSKPVLLSGHNRWSKIKHDKVKEDAGKSKQRSALVQEIKAIAKLHGADPATNPRLAALVAIAKKSGLPKTTLEGAIARGAGKSLSGVNLEPVTIEAMLPSSVATIIECQTDNRLRTLQDIRYIIKDFGGTVTPTSHLFERLGKLVLQGADGVIEEDVFDLAIESGATDVEILEDGNIVIYTKPQETASAAESLAKSTDLQIISSDIIWSPKADMKVESAPGGVLEGFVGMISPLAIEDKVNQSIDKLEEDPSVQSVYLNV